MLLKFPVTESYPSFKLLLGMISIAKGIASSPIPKTAPPKENNMNITGMSTSSEPLLLLIIEYIPLSTAPVFKIIPKAPPNN